MQRLTNRIGGFYETYRPPRVAGSIEDFEEAREEYCRRDLGGICLLAANVLAWAGVAIVIWRMR